MKQWSLPVFIFLCHSSTFRFIEPFQINNKIWRTGFVESSDLDPSSGFQIEEYSANSLMRCNMIANENPWARVMCYNEAKCLLSDKVVSPSFYPQGLVDPVTCMTDSPVVEASSDGLKTNRQQQTTPTTTTTTTTGSTSETTSELPTTTTAVMTTETQITATSTPKPTTTNSEMTTTTTELATTEAEITTTVSEIITTTTTTTSNEELTTTTPVKTTTTTSASGRPALVEDNFITKTFFDYESSKSNCAKENASPFVPKSQEEYEFIKGRFPGTPTIWFPLTDLDQEGVEVYEDGTAYDDNPFTPQMWMPFKKNDRVSNCVTCNPQTDQFSWGPCSYSSVIPLTCVKNNYKAA